jgi:hypothetical protein
VYEEEYSNKSSKKEKNSQNLTFFRLKMTKFFENLHFRGETQQK